MSTLQIESLFILFDDEGVQHACQKLREEEEGENKNRKSF
jgi:hypothetical protein